MRTEIYWYGWPNKMPSIDFQNRSIVRSMKNRRIANLVKIEIDRSGCTNPVKVIAYLDEKKPGRSRAVDVFHMKQ